MTTTSSAIRDQLTAQSENSTLYNNSTQANAFYVDSAVVNGVTTY